MEDEVRQKIKKIGFLQKQIILWLGDSQNIMSVVDLRNKWPSTVDVRIPSISESLERLSVAAGLSAAAGKTESRPSEYAPYLRDDYFSNRERSLTDEGWIEWNPEAVIGHKLTPQESTSLSKCIRSLEERSLIKTAKAAGKKKRISHVQLTFHGEVASLLLRGE